jgi:acyl carrier protein|tara:strand:- start:137 stop:355 length:219 start_codon:yes stop_codon:yes gene_type:complete
MNEAINIVAKVLKIDPKKLNKDSTNNEFNEWDSLAILRIFMAVEKITKKKLGSELILQMNSIKLITEIIKKD